jgi:hypothetical protein
MQKGHGITIQMEKPLSSSQEILGAVSQVSIFHGHSELLMKTPQLPSLAS